jgi:hypothetical protein
VEGLDANGERSLQLMKTSFRQGGALKYKGKKTLERFTSELRH